MYINTVGTGDLNRVKILAGNDHNVVHDNSYCICDDKEQELVNLYCLLFPDKIYYYYTSIHIM